LRRALLLAAAALPLGLALTACPIPQPLAEVARSADGGTVSTPIILPDTAQPGDTIVLVKNDCGPGAQFTLSATIEDLDTTESVEARWFLNWRPDTPNLVADQDSVPASDDPSNPQRLLAPFVFQPLALQRPAPTIDVVDVVVSNNVLPIENLTQPWQRAAGAPFVTQFYRWVFQYVDPATPGARCSFP
jgi:hypothetical protein